MSVGLCMARMRVMDMVLVPLSLVHSCMIRLYVVRNSFVWGLISPRNASAVVVGCECV